MRVLIIKLGYSETLLREAGSSVSLGDVLRTTPVLYALREKYPHSRITWVVSKEAKPLLQENPFLDRLLVWGEFEPELIQKERFDLLLNLERVPWVCRFSGGVASRISYGLTMNDSGDYRLKTKAGTPLNGTIDIAQKIIIEMLGLPWSRQEYVLGYRPTDPEIHDIGLNYRVGARLPTKGMVMERWRDLAERLGSLGYRVSWQEGFDDLYVYMNWINSCSLLVTGDSLGLHLALALKKRLIGLFGPTDPKEIFFYPGSHFITSRTECNYMPCYAKECISGHHCMDHVDLDEIVRKTEIVLPKREARH